jgi:hypothetical protein
MIDADACVKEQAMRKSSPAEATVAFTFGDSEYVVELRRLVKPGGIWTPTRIEIHPRR